jgi:protoporphyrinogen oxidase
LEEREIHLYILGGGPVGMALVDGLVDLGEIPFTLIDRGPRLGGLAQTAHWEGVGDHDLGPHKIFSLDRELVSRVEALLPPSDWLTRDKISAIYMKGRYLSYPPSPLSLASVFGLSAFCRMIASYGGARLMSLFYSPRPKTFEEDLVSRLGRDLYYALFKPIALKLWGEPATLDVKLSRGRVQTPSLTEVLARMLNIRKSSDFEALTFRYPKGGLGQIWNAIERKVQGKGKILLSHGVTGLKMQEGRVISIQCEHNGQTKTFDVNPDDFVVSTLPLALTTRLLSDGLSSRILDLVDRMITLNDLLLVFFHMDVKSLMKESWIFVPDPDIIFHRLSEQESFDPAMSPSGSIVCCEIMSSHNRKLSDCSDAYLVAEAQKGLHDMGYREFNILGNYVIRFPKSYPVYRAGFEAGLTEVLQHLDSMKNFRTIGRQGAFNYIGTLDAMDIGYGFIRWFGQRADSSWVKERERTHHYPVLD